MLPVVKNFFVASLVYFLFGLLAQTAAAFDVWLGFNPLAYTTVIATGQVLLIGWLSQLAVALVYDRWLLPTPKAGMMVFVLFNVGLPLVIIGQPGLVLLGGSRLAVLVALGALLLLFAGLIFLWQAWKFLKEQP